MQSLSLQVREGCAITHSDVIYKHFIEAQRAQRTFYDVCDRQGCDDCDSLLDSSLKGKEITYHSDLECPGQRHGRRQGMRPLVGRVETS